LGIVGCKAKKKSQKTMLQAEEVSNDTIVNNNKIEESEPNVIIHKPGTINQGSLDSIKAIKKKHKRGTTK
jgi:hypothetical protein